jgi:uncharacterized membrane protein YgcG
MATHAQHVHFDSDGNPTHVQPAASAAAAAALNGVLPPGAAMNQDIDMENGGGVDQAGHVGDNGHQGHDVLGAVGAVAPAAAIGGAGLIANPNADVVAVAAEPSNNRIPGLKPPTFDTGDQAAVDHQLALTFVRQMEAYRGLSNSIDPTDSVVMSNLMVCQLAGTAATWLDNYLRRVPEPTWDELKSAFIQRWAPEVRTREAEAHDKLHERKLMQGSMSVVQYKAFFDQSLLPIAHTLTQPLLVRAFTEGLKTDLSVKCICDDKGMEYPTLDAVFTAALGYERKAAREAMLTKRPAAALNAVSGPPQKRASYASAAAGGSAGPSNSGGGRGRGGGRGGRGGRGGGRFAGRGAPPTNAPPAKRLRSDDPREAGCGIFHPIDGHELTFNEKRRWLRAGMCFNCADPGHMKTACPKPKKPYVDNEKVFRG